MSARRKKPVYSVAPGATDEPGDRPAPEDGDVPREPPQALGLPTEPPVFRPLKVYAFDPTLGRQAGNVMTIPVRYEKLRPGPVGERVAVVDYDSSRDCFYDPVDLDDPLIAIRGGLDPSESDPHFHQQMAYAVTCETLRRVESALGRTVCRRTPDGVAPLRLLVYPHAMKDANAWALLEDSRLMFGYFPASENATGRTFPGQIFFNCLSHDVIVHTTMHAIISAMRPDLLDASNASAWESHVDVGALHEGLCDVAALLLHFSYREAVLDTIQRTAGSIHRSTFETNGAADESVRIQAEIGAGNPLLAMGQGFGEALGQTGGLRSALGQKPDPKDLERLTEPHQRGGILVAAIFDAFFSVYLQRSLDLFKIYRAGGGRLDSGDLPAPLAERLFLEVDAIASRVFNTILRALDYCPACDMTLGDFLRACITADYEQSRIDDWGVRNALMQAFRRRGIKPDGASFFSEDALRWPTADPDDFEEIRAPFKAMPEPDESSARHNQRVLRAFVLKNARALGPRPRARLDIRPLEVGRVVATDNDLQVVLCTTVVQAAPKADGATGPRGVRLVFERTGTLRYAIRTRPFQPPRPDRRRSDEPVE
jgi:hypothetical protein